VKRFVFLTIAMLLAFSLQAQDVELREDHPREYVVQEGDTLWDIAGRFLTRPWQWPAIWHANPQIDNPHRIYPGDVITLVFVGGEPRLTVSDAVDDSIRRLSPEVRRESIEGPITTIPFDAIESFLTQPRVVSAEEYESLPYVVANNEQRIYAGPGDRTYVRGMTDARVGAEVIIARPLHQFEDRSKQPRRDNPLRRNIVRLNKAQVPSSVRPSGAVWKTTFGRLERFDYPIVGYELWESARARVLKAGDPTILEIMEGGREVGAGDVVLPLDDHIYDASFFPRAMDRVPERARVLAVAQNRFGAGHYQIIAINLGEVDGVQPGHTFSAFRPGETISDTQRYRAVYLTQSEERDRSFVTLPDEYAGQVMVFRAFDRVSYAIVLEGSTHPISEGDRLDHPDRRL